MFLRGGLRSGHSRWLWTSSVRPWPGAVEEHECVCAASGAAQEWPWELVKMSMSSQEPELCLLALCPVWNWGSAAWTWCCLFPFTMPWAKRAFMEHLNKWQGRLFNKICSIFLQWKDVSYLLVVPSHLLTMGAVLDTSLYLWLALEIHTELERQDRESLRVYWEIHLNILVFGYLEQS